MRLVNFFSACASAFNWMAGGTSKIVDFFDRAIHYREYREAERRAKIVRTILLILGVVLVVLFFPYKIRIEKNGDYEIRTLLLKMHRKTKPNELEESDLDFGMDDHHVADVEVV